MSWVEAELREQPAALERFLAAETAQARGWGAALTLIALAFILMIVARLVTARFTRYSR